MIINKISLFIFLIFITANSEYFIQLKASEIKSESISIIDSLKREGIPAILTEGIVKSKQYYRVRVGGFINKDNAVAYANFLDINSPYIVKDENVGQGISLFIDTINTGSQIYGDIEIFKNSEKKILAVYYRPLTRMENYNPVFLNVYNFISKKKEIIKNVTGFDLSGEFIDLGIKKTVFYNPEGEPIGNKFDKEISLFGKKFNISKEIIKNSIFTYGDILPQASITLLYSFNINDFELSFKNKIGFDYIDKSDNKYLNTDALNIGNGKWGRDGLAEMSINRNEIYKKDNFTIKIKKLENSETRIRICLLYVN